MKKAFPVTIIIPTCGEATFLRAVLGGLSQQTAQPAEVLVIDNNRAPTHSEALLRRLCPNLFVMHEPCNGLQHARNTGAARARGTILAFLDDDSVPSPTWLDALIDGMQRHKADAAGGTVSLTLHSHPPRWLSTELRALLSELLYDGQDIPVLPDNMYVVGANFAVTRSAFETAGLFDPRFDRTASSLRSSGELEYTRRLQSRGRIISFVAAAHVTHHILKTRLTPRYFYVRSFWQGRSDALLESKCGRPTSFGIRNWRLNIVALCHKAIAVARNVPSSTRQTLLFALVREAGYCMQAFLSNGSRIV